MPRQVGVAWQSEGNLLLSIYFMDKKPKDAAVQQNNWQAFSEKPEKGNTFNPLKFQVFLIVSLVLYLACCSVAGVASIYPEQCRVGSKYLQ